MTKVNLKTIGAAPSEIMEFDTKKIADFFQEEISGYPATELQATFVTQEFIDTFEIKAKYHSGTFLGFKASEEAEEEFETFKKK
jgi:hypothetical protein